MDQDSVPPTNLHRWVKSAIRSLIYSAIAVAAVCWIDPTNTTLAFDKLKDFGPETISTLLADARFGCGPDNSSILKAGRNCTAPLVEGWPAAGQWTPRLGLVNTGLFGSAITVADVAAHLIAPTTVSDLAAKTLIGLLGALQLLFGFGITVLLLRPIAKALDDVWFIVLTTIGTLFIGAAVAWLIFPAIGLFLNAIPSLKANSLVASVIGVAVVYAGGTSILKFLLGKSLARLTDDAVDSVADKTAKLFIRYVP